MQKLFTITVPIYDLSEDTNTMLDEAIRTLIDQTIGFDSIYIDIIDSTESDAPRAVCLKYCEAYPENIRYRKVPDVPSGLYSSIADAAGKYYTVYDPHNSYEPNALETIRDFFDNAPEWFDVMTFRMGAAGVPEIALFQKRYKQGTMILDVDSYARYLNTSFLNTIVRTEAFSGITLDESVDYNVDSYIITSVLVNNPKLGICTDTLLKCSKFLSTGFYKYYPSNDPERISSIERYYDAMFEMSEFPMTDYIENMLLYDLRNFVAEDHSYKTVHEDLSGHVDAIISKVTENIDGDRIEMLWGLTAYQKLGLFLMKYGQKAIPESSVSFGSMIIDQHKAFDFGSAGVFNVYAIYQDGKSLVFDTSSKMFFTNCHVDVYIRSSSGKVYHPEVKPYSKANFTINNTLISEGKQLTFRIPLKAQKLSFYIKFNRSEIKVRPWLGVDSKLVRSRKKSCFYTDAHIVSYFNGTITISEKTFANQRSAEIMYQHELKNVRGAKGVKDRKDAIQLEKSIHDAKLKDRVIFATARSNEQMLPNLKSVWDAYKGDKISFTHRAPYSNEVFQEVARNVYTSKVIVTDDYFMPLRKYGKKPGQKVVQIWHASGAFKKFGVDGTTMFPGVDALYHKDYDVVVTSSEHIRQFYAQAFQIDIDRVKALGFPRSDRFFDPEYIKERTELVYDRYPELVGKEVIVYAPTFRNIRGSSQRTYIPDVDYSKISESLREDQIMVLCPHPMMKEYDASLWTYDNIKLVQDTATMDIMLTASLLITDYSSIIFDYSLLNKPMLFFCYDYNDFDRDFYLDYETDLPGDIVYTTEELIDHLVKGGFETDERLTKFKEKFVGACDGKSSERVAALLEELVKA